MSYNLHLLTYALTSVIRIEWIKSSGALEKMFVNKILIVKTKFQSKKKKKFQKSKKKNLTENIWNFGPSPKFPRGKPGIQ